MWVLTDLGHRADQILTIFAKILESLETAFGTASGRRHRSRLARSWSCRSWQRHCRHS